LLTSTRRRSAASDVGADAASGCESIKRVLISLSHPDPSTLIPGTRVREYAHLASVKNASSTPSFAFALVSRNLNPNSSASARPWSSETARFSSQSHLLPIRILLTPEEACCSMLECQVRMSASASASALARAHVSVVMGRKRERCPDQNPRGRVEEIE